MFNNKAPMFLDMGDGRNGTFIKTIDSDEPSMALIVFRPVNSFKDVIYDNPIPKSWIVSGMSTKQHLKGVAKSYVFVVRPKGDSILSTGNEENIRIIAELTKRLSQKDIQIATLEKENKDYASGMSKKVAESKKTFGNGRSYDNPMNPNGQRGNTGINQMENFRRMG